MTYRPVALFLFALGILALEGCRARRFTRPDTSTDRQSLRHGGRERTYVVRVPSGVTATTGRVALVIVLHGGGGNALNAETMTGFTDKARTDGFIVAYPDGTSGRGSLFTWNAGHCCGYAMEQRVDDAGFISALIDHLVVRHPIDRTRVYVTGMSNGAMMSHRVGIELAGKVAAIAPVVGAVFGDEARPRARVSAIMINGMMDSAVPYDGGLTEGRTRQAWDGTPAKSAMHQARFWAEMNGCSLTPRASDRGAYLTHAYECPAGTEVVIYSVKDNGHAWPGGKAGTRRGDTPSTSLNATDVIWSFFRAHPGS